MMNNQIEELNISQLYNFSEKQKEARRAVMGHKYTLYGGAMGGGKSYWLRWMLVRLLMGWYNKTGISGIEVGLFSKDYPTLKDRHLSKIEKEFPDWLGTFHGEHRSHGRCYVLHESYGGGIIKFRNLDEPSKYKSAEFAAIAVDEITENTEDVFNDLRNRLRWTGIEDTKFICGTNPGGIGHAWVKKLWMDRLFDENETEQHEFKYVQALATDNPHLAKSYMNTLDSLPAEMRRAYRDGDWDIFKGQYFTEWRREVHVCQPFEIPTHWPRYICGDYGYTAPSAVLWVAVDEDGVQYVYREIYATGLTYEKLAEEIISKTQPHEKIQYWVFDPAIWAKKDSPISGADRMMAIYKEIKKESLNIIRGVNERVVGWGMVREYLKPFRRNERLMAKLQVFPNCENLIRTLPSLVYDENRIEDVDSDGDDHCSDALRYGIMSKCKSSGHKPTHLEINFDDELEEYSENKIPYWIK